MPAVLMKMPALRIKPGKAASQGARALAFLRAAGVARSRDFEGQGLTRATLRRLVASGAVEQIGRGLYTLPETDLGEKQTLIEAALMVPRGIICLLSALRFHGLTTQNPREVWMAVGHKARSPAGGDVPMRVVRLSGRSLMAGVREHRVPGAPAVTLRVYDPAKTVADCFKFRHLVGHDVALEALRDCRRQRKATMDQLWAAAKIDRVANLIRPYLEAIA